MVSDRSAEPVEDPRDRLPSCCCDGVGVVPLRTKQGNSVSLTGTSPESITAAMASAGEPEKNVRTTCAMDDVPASSESDVHDLALAAAQRNERVGLARHVLPPPVFMLTCASVVTRPWHRLNGAPLVPSGAAAYLSN
jgi:hypothetical protein